MVQRMASVLRTHVRRPKAVLEPGSDIGSELRQIGVCCRIVQRVLLLVRTGGVHHLIDYHPKIPKDRPHRGGTKGQMAQGTAMFSIEVSARHHDYHADTHPTRPQQTYLHTFS